MWLERGTRPQISVHHPGSDLPGKTKNVFHSPLLSSRKVQEGERRAVLSSPGVLKGTTLIITHFTKSVQGSPPGIMGEATEGKSMI